jgi:hypothetical protein
MVRHAVICFGYTPPKGSYMPYYWNTGIFWSSGGGEQNNTAPWTVDLNMPPSSAYGLSGLTYHRHGGGNSGADVGFLPYVTQDPDTGEHVTSGLGGTMSGWLDTQ